MTTDLVPVPITGELLDLSADDDVLAEAFDRIRDLERQLKQARDTIAEELTARLDRRALWTCHAGQYTIKVPSPKPRLEWDVDALQRTLDELQGQGVIDEAAVDRAIRIELVRKPQTAGINALMKLNPGLAERIQACAREVSPPRRVSVTFNQGEK